MDNVAGCVEIGLNLFAGMNLELGETDVPQGLSPSCSDVAFLPGSFFTRPPFTRFSTLGTSAQVVYHHSFIRPDGGVTLLQCTSDGKIYADGAQVGSTRAGNRFYAQTAFGKTYIAVSDGLHGADVPLQYTPEGYLDRVSQDGPGAGVSATNLSIPVSTMLVGTSSGTTYAVTSISTTDLTRLGTMNYYTAYVVNLSVGLPMSLFGNAVAVTGNSSSGLNQTYSVDVILTTSGGLITSFKSQTAFTPTFATGTGGTVTASATTGTTATRLQNVVSVQTTAPHNLMVGNRIGITGMAASVVGTSVVSITVANATANNVATVKTSTAHGLAPGSSVNITGVSPVAVGGGITSAQVSGQNVTFTTAAAHGLSIGSIINISGTNTPAVCDGQWAVATVPTATTFGIVFTGTGAGSGTNSGTVSLVFPGQATTDTSVFQVLACPDATTFQVTAATSDGVWTTGSVTFQWNGTFYVASVPTSTSLTYSQVGPDATSTSVGTITPMGQIAPGKRGCVCIFQTRTGYLTVPSPISTVICEGGQSLTISGLPIGPANVVARIIAFTGANGGRYFYLPVAPRDPSTNQLIGTSTVIQDNTTTTVVLDFADEALFAALAIDIPGNNLFRQVVLGPCLGFYAYADRLFAWGERNKIQQFLNMGFEGGTLAATPNVPLGWTITGAGTLGAGDYGLSWIPTGGAVISQTAYQDENGVAILQPNTQYTFRAWTNGTLTAVISSASTGYTSTATITAASGFAQANYSLKTPAAIAPDTVISFSGAPMDELEIIYTSNPYIIGARVSYVNNPEAFDGVTGYLSPLDQTHPIMGMEVRRDVLCLLTRGPNGSLYETEDTSSGEPSSWSVREVAGKCGLTSVWGLAKFEDWFCWTSDTGLRIFDGGSVDKMSQEVQTLWDAINPNYSQLSVLANDPYVRRIYILTANGTATVPNTLQVLDYRELNTAGLLANSGTLRIGIGGKVVTTDLTRKWTTWTATMNYAGLILLASGEGVMAFDGGTGTTLSAPANSAIYTLNEGALTGVDADYGPFWQKSFYCTYFFVSQEEAAQNKLGSHRLKHIEATMNITGNGSVMLTASLNRIGNDTFSSRWLNIAPDLARDIEIPMRGVNAERVSYRFNCQPQPGQTSAGMNISEFVVGMITHPFSPVRGLNRS